MVDVVLYLEGERYLSYRILRGVKNRFGSTNEIGMFEMEQEGMTEILNPSEVLISEGDENPAGSVIVATMEGTRPILVELQALTTLSVFGFPRRTANGIDFNRLTLLMAVIEKRAKISLSNQDAYLNVVGGIKINEPSVDLGIILSVCSSYKNIPIPNDIVAIGEVGLTGEVRRVTQIEKQLKEAEKLGFKKCIIPENNKKLLKEKFKLDIIGVKNITDALEKVRNNLNQKFTKEVISLKNEKGITLMSLVITIVMMSILAVAGVNYGTSTIKAMQYKNFNYQLEQIQGRVDVIHEKIISGDDSYKTIGESAAVSSNANSVLTSLGLKSSDYRYFTPQNLEKFLDISNVEQEVAINFDTKDVVSIRGFLYEGKVHHRLND